MSMVEHGELRPLKLALVSCGKAKLDRPAAARDLYTGSLFRAARRHAEEGGYDGWRILSARHFLLRPDRVIEPYDLAIGDLTPAERHLWGEVVSGLAICSWLPLRDRRPIVVDVFAGQAYVDALPSVWTRGDASEPTVELRFPHAGLQIGERLHAFATARHGRLVCPPGGVVFDPFAGSGTTLEAAHLEGFGDQQYRERLWASPHCLSCGYASDSLFGGAA